MYIIYARQKYTFFFNNVAYKGKNGYFCRLFIDKSW